MSSAGAVIKSTKKQPQKLSKPRTGNHNVTLNQTSTAPSPSTSTSQVPTDPNGKPLVARRHSAVPALSTFSPIHSPVLPNPASPAAAPELDARYQAAAIPQHQDVPPGVFRSKSRLEDRATRRSTWSPSLSGAMPRVTTTDCQVPGATADSLRPDDSPGPSIPQGDWDTSLHAPVRRCSIICTPGLATRAATEEDTSQNSGIRHNRSVTSITPRSRCGSVDSTSNRLLSLPPPCLDPRAHVDNVLTPSEAEYKQLGAIQFGSLRITNGLASPAPSTDGEVVDQDQVKDLTNKSREVQRADQGDNRMESSTIVQTESSNGAYALSLAGDGMTGSGHSNVWSETERISRERASSHKRTHPGLLPVECGGTVASPNEHGPGALCKADSGYSSASSLGSLRSKANSKFSHSGPKETHKTESTEAPPPAAEDGGSKNSSEWKSPGFTATEITASTVASAYPQNSHAYVTGHGEPGAVRNSQGYDPSQTRKLRRKRQALSFNAGHGRSELPPSDEQRYPGSGNSHPIPIPDVERSVAKKHRFQKLLSGVRADGRPTVQLAAPTSKEMVSDPRGLGSNHPEHRDQFSVADRHTALHSQQSRDTLQTILSVGSEEHGPTSQEEAQPNAREGSKVLRRRSVQSPSMTSRSPSLTPKPSIRRKPWSWGQKPKAEAQQLDGGDWVKHSFESSVTSIDSISSSVGKSAFDQAFTAMPDRCDGELSPTKRSMTMPVQIERDLNLMRRPSGSRAPFRLSYVSSSRSSPIPEIPGMLPPNVSKAKTPPPVSLRRHSAKAFLLPPRPQSTPVNLKRSASDRRPPSRGGSNSAVEPEPPVPPIPSKNPAQYTEIQRFESATSADRNAWRPNHASSKSSAENNAGAVTPGRLRPAGANHLVGLGPPMGPRRHASYDDNLINHRQRRRHDTPQPGHHHSGLQNPTQSGSYYQNQLLQIERSTLGDAAWRQHRHSQGGRARHSRAGMQGSQGPYRILHSYNSPAYRNVPIWS